MVNEFLGVWNKDFILSAFTVIFTVVYISFAYYYMTRLRRRRADRDQKLKDAISNGLVNGQVEGVDDLVNLYRGVTNSSDDDVSYKAGVSRILRRLLVALASDSESTQPKRMLKIKIKELLRLIEAETPFADLPTAERNLILDARKFIHANELQAASQKIDGLANLIEARQDAYDKLQSANRWSVPLAVIGVVLTVVFGVMSLLP
jgi:hypothetical protein